MLSNSESTAESDFLAQASIRSNGSSSFSITAITRWLMNHNPFYVISAALVLYGIHLSFTGKPEVADGWTLMKLLGGYSLLLAVSGALIVRLGQVWEDARTVLLLIVLIFVAMSCSYDEVCLINPLIGAKFLAAGWLFSIVLTELVLRALKINLSIWYRVPFYLQLLLLFAYPAGLAHLLLSDRELEMTWSVLGFSTLAGITCLMLFPAARFAGTIAKNNGTPWPWPWFPWPLFVFVGLGFCVRAYSLTVCFELELGMQSGFQSFFLIPLGFAAAIVALEVALQGELPRLRWLAVWAPLLLLLAAGSAAGQNQMQRHFASMVGNQFGNPLLITIVGLAVYYAYAWLRAVPDAESMFVGMLICTIFVSDQGVGWPARLVPQTNGAIAFVMYCLIRSLWSRFSFPMALAILATLGLACWRYPGSWFVAHSGFLPLHLGIVATLGLGLVYRDSFGRFLRAMAPYLLPALALICLLGSWWLFPHVPWFWLAGYVAALWMLGVAYWAQQPRLRQALMVASLGVCFALTLAEAIWRQWGAEIELAGARWISWGLVCLALACIISLAKSGSGHDLLRYLAGWNDWAAKKRAHVLGDSGDG